MPKARGKFCETHDSDRQSAKLQAAKQGASAEHDKMLESPAQTSKYLSHFKKDAGTGKRPAKNVKEVYSQVTRQQYHGKEEEERWMHEFRYKKFLISKEGYDYNVFSPLQ